MYLVDGNNLIGHTRDLSLKERNCRQRLIDRLIPFLNQKRKKAVVFFDGIGEPLRKSHRIQIEFSGRDLTADRLICRRVGKKKAPRSLCVVSSDNAVYGYARSCGSRALKCHEFNRLLNDLGDTGTHSDDPVLPEDLKPDEGVPTEDIKDWLRYFGEEHD